MSQMTVDLCNQSAVTGRLVTMETHLGICPGSFTGDFLCSPSFVKSTPPPFVSPPPLLITCKPRDHPSPPDFSQHTQVQGSKRKCDKNTGGAFVSRRRWLYHQFSLLNNHVPASSFRTFADHVIDHMVPTTVPPITYRPRCPRIRKCRWCLSDIFVSIPEVLKWAWFKLFSFPKRCRKRGRRNRKRTFAAEKPPVDHIAMIHQPRSQSLVKVLPSDFSILSGTRTPDFDFLTPQRYDEHPRPFQTGVPFPGHVAYRPRTVTILTYHVTDRVTEPVTDQIREITDMHIPYVTNHVTELVTDKLPPLYWQITEYTPTSYRPHTDKLLTTTVLTTRLVCCYPGRPVPPDVYQRLRTLEERILTLEGLSPEYFQDRVIVNIHCVTSSW